MRPSAAVASASVVLLALAACTSPSQRGEMSRQSLSSDAAEGARLADQVDRGRVSRIFARAHAQELADDVSAIEKKIADNGTTNGAELLRLADQLDTALGTISIHPADHAVARRAEDTLTDLRDDLDQVGS
ncbi:MAG TPA: hypothetical protein VFE07_11050 [Marmoricola sp.]|jgi:hypothetical protein|nr:hypothetical protein [Marmoricola sp.]